MLLFLTLEGNGDIVKTYFFFRKNGTSSLKLPLSSLPFLFKNSLYTVSLKNAVKICVLNL